MGTKAIFKIWLDNKFVLGSWVKYDGGINDTCIFPHFLTSLNKFDLSKKHLYDIINKFVLDSKFNNLSYGGNAKRPFKAQMNDSFMGEVNVLFWEKNIGDKKLMEEYVWGEYIYEVRITDTQVKIKVIYGINEKEYVLKNAWEYNSQKHTNFLGKKEITKLLTDANKWVYDLDYGLNDCNCGEDNKEITEENI
jgi:hypothetical protein